MHTGNRSAENIGSAASPGQSPLLAGGETLSPIAVIAAIPLAIAGGYLSRFVLETISEEQFRAWSRYVIGAVSTVYLIQGMVLL